jgi:rfaE bifunctional protein nucleotidyltransferase chain/domain
MTSKSFEIPDKLRELDALVDLCAGLRRQGKTIAWTNGCFEILHAGHIAFLLKAARLADVFIVGVNSDDSVAALKGPGHPVSPEHERVQVLSAVECIDYITVFSERTCTTILQQLQPDVYVKGMQHLHGGINDDERAVIEASGGCIALVAGDQAQSTKSIIERIRAGH